MALWSVDFNVMNFHKGDIFFVAPGQVHYDVKENECDCWDVAVETSLMPKEYLRVFENAVPYQKQQNMNLVELEQFQTILRLFSMQLAGDSDAVYYRKLAQERLWIFLCMLVWQSVKNDITGGDAVLCPQ